MIDTPPALSPSGKLSSVHQMTPAERAYIYAITIEWIEPTGDNIILGMRSWKTQRGQHKHWKNTPPAKEKTRFVLVKHGLAGPEEAKPIAPATVERLMRKDIETVLAHGSRNMRVVSGQLGLRSAPAKQARAFKRAL